MLSMGLRGWGIALLFIGLLTVGAGVLGVLEGRHLWVDANARCVGSTDEFCGAGQTLVASILIGLSPLGSLLGLLAMLAGGALLALRAWLHRSGARDVLRVTGLD